MVSSFDLRFLVSLEDSSFLLSLSHFFGKARPKILLGYLFIYFSLKTIQPGKMFLSIFLTSLEALWYKAFLVILNFFALIRAQKDLSDKFLKSWTCNLELSSKQGTTWSLGNIFSDMALIESFF